jgi:hypothetical protein
MQQDVPYLPELPTERMVPSALSDGLPLALPAFLDALKARRPPVAKAQVAGPGTALATIEHLGRKVASLARALKGANVTALLFLDEPGLGAGAMPVAGLEHLRRIAHDEGAIAGIHCCAQTRWADLLSLGFDVISLDARLSLDALLEDRRAWLRFLEAGGTLCLGIIPTDPGARYDIGELCDSVEASLRATTPRFEQVLSRMLLSPACGLALHSPEDAERITREVREAQARLRALI